MEPGACSAGCTYLGREPGRYTGSGLHYDTTSLPSMYLPRYVPTYLDSL